MAGDGEHKAVKVEGFCSFCCDEPATHMVAAKYYPEHYDLLCVSCVGHGLGEGWYPHGAKIRKMSKNNPR